MKDQISNVIKDKGYTDLQMIMDDMEHSLYPFMVDKNYVSNNLEFLGWRN